MSYSRRQLLRRGGIAALGVAGGVLALPEPPAPQAAERPDELINSGDTPSSLIESENETPYALWMYSRHPEGFEPTSPINVVISLAHSERTLADVMDVFWEADWEPWPVEYIRYAYNAHTDTYERTHQTAAQTRFGGFGRFHIRVWDVDGFVSIQAHEDSYPQPGHKVLSHERGKWLIERLFHEDGWIVSPDATRFDNASDPDHDGLVTVIIG